MNTVGIESTKTVIIHRDSVKMIAEAVVRAIDARDVAREAARKLRSAQVLNELLIVLAAGAVAVLVVSGYHLFATKAHMAWDQWWHRRSH